MVIAGCVYSTGRLLLLYSRLWSAVPSSRPRPSLGHPTLGRPHFELNSAALAAAGLGLLNFQLQRSTHSVGIVSLIHLCRFEKLIVVSHTVTQCNQNGLQQQEEEGKEEGLCGKHIVSFRCCELNIMELC